jgi:hypothetical protein
MKAKLEGTVSGRDARRKPVLGVCKSLIIICIRLQHSALKLNRDIGKNITRIAEGYPCFRLGRSDVSEPGSSVSIVFGYGQDDRAIKVRSLAEAKGFFL